MSSINLNLPDWFLYGASAYFLIMAILGTINSRLEFKLAKQKQGKPLKVALETFKLELPDFMKTLAVYANAVERSHKKLDKRKAKAKPKTNPKIKKAKKLYNDGLSYQEIADKIGVSYPTARKYVQA